jgi:hypothetical protein
MPEVLKNYEDSAREAHSPHFSLAICEMEGRYCRSNACREGGRKFLVVVVDYFTKWAEAEALAAITTTNITSFLWKSVVCRFGIPHAFVTDNGKQFDCEPFRRWCSKLRI